MKVYKHHIRRINREDSQCLDVASEIPLEVPSSAQCDSLIAVLRMTSNANTSNTGDIAQPIAISTSNAQPIAMSTCKLIHRCAFCGGESDREIATILLQRF
ncbi:Hypothetical predicted protein [Octopus vulgaris]|uniref:Uncharacterized protein n=1 Tax=Octopus vulgaris TaxID=6645 RepID=A0AA36BBR9_OCTVU|nr:Hypothetical predicted protein [Octopus vulgaris]